MKDAGFGGDSYKDLLYSMIFLTIVNTIANFTGAVMAKKYGRRQLIMMFSIPMGVALLVLTGVMVINTQFPGQFKCKYHFIVEQFDWLRHGIVGGIICILSLAAYLIFFCIGFAT